MWCRKRIETRADGLTYETWTRRNLLHRKDGPAEIETSGSGRLSYQAWWQNGMLHRTDGPALVIYADDGSVHDVRWFVNGEEVNNERIAI